MGMNPIIINIESAVTPITAVIVRACIIEFEYESVIQVYIKHCSNHNGIYSASKTNSLDRSIVSEIEVAYDRHLYQAKVLFWTLADSARSCLRLSISRR